MMTYLTSRAAELRAEPSLNGSSRRRFSARPLAPPCSLEVGAARKLHGHPGTDSAERASEAEQLGAQLARLKLLAPADGAALFSDAQDLQGRPAQIGERVMVVEDPAAAGVTAWLSPDDAIALDRDADARVYLNVSPLSSIPARVVSTSYEASSGPDGQPAYVVKALFEPGAEIPRLGLRGTAKLYGPRAPLIYHALRKPLRALRAALGL